MSEAAVPDFGCRAVDAAAVDPGAKDLQAAALAVAYLRAEDPARRHLGPAAARPDLPDRDLADRGRRSPVAGPFSGRRHAAHWWHTNSRSP